MPSANYPSVTPDSTEAEKAVHLLRKSGRRIGQVARGPYGSQLLVDLEAQLKEEAARIIIESNEGVQLGLPDIAED